MKRATITVPTELEEAIERYVQDQEAPLALTAIVQAALREYLTDRGYLGERRVLRIQPWESGSGKSDISIEHDRYLTERT
jgi:hypothetical protein